MSDDDRARAFADLMVQRGVPFTAPEDFEAAMNTEEQIMDQPRTIADLLADHPDFQRATFAMIKSHVADNTHTLRRVIIRILDEGFVIAAMMKTTVSLSQIAWLYRDHVGKPYYNDLVQSVAGPVVPMALLGPDVIVRWRALLGATNPVNAESGTLRATFGNYNLVAENVAHGSDSEPTARAELACFFPSEIRLWR